MKLSFERGTEIGRQVEQLPAVTYNRLTVLFARGSREPLFVPIRSMQYLAIIDREEVVFVDGASRRFIEISWQNFRRRDRDDLQQPVDYDRVFYQRATEQVSQRLQTEFLKALMDLERKQAEADSHDASVTPIDRQRGAEEPGSAARCAW